MVKNRHARRAAVASVPKVPNISGTNEACGNCAMSPDRRRVEEIVGILAVSEMKAGRPAPQPPAADEVWCLAEPQERAKKTWAWCSKWKARA